VLHVGRLEEELLEDIAALLKSGQVAHAPAGYEEARRRLERQRREGTGRRDARRRAVRR